MGSGTEEVWSDQRINVEIERSGGDPYSSRLCIGTPTLGTIRMEWHSAKIGQIIPVNWSMVMVTESLGGYVPLGFLVADAQNLVVRQAINGNFEWMLLYEDDVLPRPDAFLRLNQYMMDEEVPVVSGLYYTKSQPAEPLIFRGRGNGVYRKFKTPTQENGKYVPGDLVWADGVPTGFLLIHMSIIREMWKDCEEYTVANQVTRRMFDFPRDMWLDPETGNYRTLAGTSDLDWCTRVMAGGYFKKAGWPKYQRKKYPFLVDTNIFCGHIDLASGMVFP